MRLGGYRRGRRLAGRPARRGLRLWTHRERLMGICWRHHRRLALAAQRCHRGKRGRIKGNATYAFAPRTTSQEAQEVEDGLLVRRRQGFEIIDHAVRFGARHAGGPRGRYWDGFGSGVDVEKCAWIACKRSPVRPSCRKNIRCPTPHSGVVPRGTGRSSPPNSSQNTTASSALARPSSLVRI